MEVIYEQYEINSIFRLLPDDWQSDLVLLVSTKYCTTIWQGYHDMIAVRVPSLKTLKDDADGGKFSYDGPVKIELLYR